MPEQPKEWRRAETQLDAYHVTRYELIGGGADDWMDLPWGFRIERDGEDWIARYDERWARDADAPAQITEGDA